MHFFQYYRLPPEPVTRGIPVVYVVIGDQLVYKQSWSEVPTVAVKI
jgi:hypothetical protein